MNITFDLEDNADLAMGEKVWKMSEAGISEDNGGRESEQNGGDNFGREGGGGGGGEGGGEGEDGGGGEEEGQGNKMTRSFMRQACYVSSRSFLPMSIKENPTSF